MEAALASFVDFHEDLPSNVSVQLLGSQFNIPEALSEVFVHYSVAEFSTRNEEGGNGAQHYTMGRASAGIPTIVRGLIARGYRHAIVSGDSKALQQTCGVSRKDSVEVKVEVVEVRQEYPVTPDGMVTRRILKEGSGHESPNPGAECKFIVSGYIFEKESRAFVKTFGSRDEVESALVCSEGLWESIDCALQKMKLGEIALLQFPSSYTSLTGDFTCICSIELLEFASAALHWELSLDQKLEFALVRKKQGNVYFGLKRYERAISRYEDALEFVHYSETKDAGVLALRVACFTNLAHMHGLLREHGRVVDRATEALEIEKGNAKALLRRAVAYNGLGKPDLAMKDVNALRNVAVDKKVTVKIDQVVRESKAQFQKARDIERERYGGVFT